MQCCMGTIINIILSYIDNALIVLIISGCGTSKRVSLAKNVEIIAESHVNQSVEVSIWHEPVRSN